MYERRLGEGFPVCLKTVLQASFDFPDIEVVAQRKDTRLLRASDAILARFRVEHKWWIVIAMGHRHESLAVGRTACDRGRN